MRINILYCLGGYCLDITSILLTNIQINVQKLEGRIAKQITVNNNVFPRACQGGHLEVVKILLSRGADGSPNTITGIVPLYAATLSGNVELVRLMVQTFPHTINIASKMDKSTALHVAAGEGSEEIIKSILQVPR